MLILMICLLTHNNCQEILSWIPVQVAFLIFISFAVNVTFIRSSLVGSSMEYSSRDDNDVGDSESEY